MGTTVQETEPNVFAAYEPILRRLELIIRRRAEQHSMSRAQASILSTLVHHGKLRISDLARLENVRVPTTSNSVKVVENLGLVTRTTDPDDRRTIYITLTDTGRARIEHVLQTREHDLIKRISTLHPTHQESLGAAIPALHALLDSLESGVSEAGSSTSTGTGPLPSET